jgi:hypothetical protein
MSLRFAPPTTSFLIDLCYDLPDCKGLQDIDDESAKQADGGIITSNIEIGFTTFQFLKASSFKPFEPTEVVEEVVASPTAVVAFLEKSEKKTKVSIKTGIQKLDDENELAKVSDESKNIGKAAEAIDPSGKGGFGAKIVRLLKDSALIGSQAIGLVMSKQIAWSFAQAFVADDELTSQGDSDFMKYGVSLAAVSIQSDAGAM